MAKVFLLMNPTVSRSGEIPDLSSLSEFGEVHVLMQQGDNPMMRSVQALTTLRRRLEGYNPEEDYLVNVSGGGVLTALLLGVVLAELDVQWVNWLSYRRGHDEHGNNKTWYTPVVMSLLETPQEPYTHDYDDR